MNASPRKSETATSVDELLGRIAEQFLAGAKDGVPIRRADYESLIERHPDQASQISSVLSTLAALHALPESGDRLVGRTVGRYRVLERLGSGGMGQVFKAVDQETGKSVAVKRIGEGGLPSHRLRLKKEFHVLRQCSHPEIANVIEWIEQDAELYLVMEYVEGKDLVSIVRDEGPLDIARGVDLAMKTARVLAPLHQQGIVHRDIKPGNLMLTGEQTVRVVDFGLARIDDVATASGDASSDDDSLHSTLDQLTSDTAQLLGTLDFMAPEQALRPSDADPRADIYSLGCTLYYLITGTPPFQRKNVLETIVAMRDRDYRRLRTVVQGVPLPLDRLVHRMLAAEPSDRPQSMAAVARALERCSPRPATSYRRPTAWLAGSVTLLAVCWLLMRMPAGPVGTSWTVAQPKIGTRSPGSPVASSHRMEVNWPQTLDVGSLLKGQGNRSLEVIERIGDHRMMHWNYVIDVCYHPGGDWLFSGSWDGGVAVWNAETGEQVAVFQTDRWISDVAVSADGTVVGIATRDGPVSFWDWRGDRLVDQLAWPDDGEDSVVEFHPDLPVAAVCAERHGRIVFRDFQRRVTVGDVDLEDDAELADLEFSADGRQLISLGRGSGLQLWEWRTGDLVRTFQSRSSELRTLAADPKRPFLITGDASGFLRRYSLSQSEPVRVLRGHDAPVRRVVFHPRGDMLFTSGEDQRIQALSDDLTTVTQSIATGTRSNWGLSPHPRLPFLASCGTDQEIVQWRTDATQQRRIFESRWGKIWSLDFAADDQSLALGCADGTVRIWDLDRQAVDKSLRGHDREVSAVRFRPGRADELASAARDGRVLRWDLAKQTSQPTHSHPGSAFCLAYSPDSRYLASGGWDRVIHVSDLQNGESFSLTGHTQMINDLVFGDRDGLLVSAGGDRMSPHDPASVRVWDLASRRATGVVSLTSAATAVARFGDRLLYGGYESCPPSLFSLRDSGSAETLPQSVSGSICWDLDADESGSILAMGDGQGTLTLWNRDDKNRWRVLDRWVLGPAGGELQSVSLSRNGERLAVALGNGQLILLARR